VLDKWKKAVIHIECATDKEHVYDKIEKVRWLTEENESGEISQDEFIEKRLKIWGKFREIRSWGTASFLIHNSKRYLVTAGHVVWDEKSAEREFDEEKKRTESSPENIRGFLLQDAEERKQNRIFSIIFRVPSHDEYDKINLEDENSVAQFLMNLGTGPTYSRPYTFSSQVDLAVISLDQQEDSRFADELKKLDYEPISLEDIADEPTQEGSEIFTVGFPDSISFISTLKRYAVEPWSSEMFSYPAFAFGRVSMLAEKLPYFWADMSVYPGNSGGPVIEDDKLVGIVIANACVPESVDLTLQSQKLNEISLDIRIPFGQIVKAKYLVDLIKQQEQKDSLFPHTRST
jgi:hypothetical protein